MSIVSDIETRGIRLIVSFTDGHTMITRRNTGGWSPSNAIDTFTLSLNGEVVAKYQSPYQYPRNTDGRNGFVLLQKGYDPARVAEYWTAADSHIRAIVREAGGAAELSKTSEMMAYAFELLSHGHQDMLNVAEGRAEVHTA